MALAQRQSRSTPPTREIISLISDDEEDNDDDDDEEKQEGPDGHDQDQALTTHR